MTSVTGTTYTSTRPRGLAPWSPQKATQARVEAILGVLDDYRDYLPMTARQMFYRLVTSGVVGKTEKSYATLSETLNRARRSGLVPWNAVRDDGVTSSVPFGYRTVEDVERSIAYDVENFHLAFDPGVEVWVEAAGMLPMVARAVREFRVPVYSSGGFDSVTAKHDAARRMISTDTATTVLHLGDLDPSGRAVVDSAADDVETFCRDYGRTGIVRFERIAVTPGQVDEFDLPTAPPKKTDRRGDEMSETVQAEAFAPDQLVDLVRQAVENVINLDAFAEHREVERDARRLLGDRMFGGTS